MPAGDKVVYFNGVRLWEWLKHWKPTPTRGAPIRKTGVARKLSKQNPHSPNFTYEIAVHTSVRPVTALAGTHLGRQETFNLQMLQTEQKLIEQSDGHGYLAWVQDNSWSITPTAVINPGSFPGTGTIQHGVSPPYTPAVGNLILLRNPTTGDGFVSPILSLGTNEFQLSFAQSVSTSWRAMLVEFYFPEAVFENLQGWESASQAEDRHTFNATYLFTATAHLVYPSGYTVDLT